MKYLALLLSFVCTTVQAQTIVWTPWVVVRTSYAAPLAPLPPRAPDPQYAAPVQQEWLPVEQPTYLGVFNEYGQPMGGPVGSPCQNGNCQNGQCGTQRNRAPVTRPTLLPWNHR